jgi:hypothetical protein
VHLHPHGPTPHTGTVKIWDIRNFACVQTLLVEDADDAIVSSVTSFAACPTHKRLAFGGPALYFMDSISEVDINPEWADQRPTVACLYNADQVWGVTLCFVSLSLCAFSAQICICIFVSRFFALMPTHTKSCSDCALVTILSFSLFCPFASCLCSLSSHLAPTLFFSV